MRIRKRRALEASLPAADSQNTLLGYVPTTTIIAWDHRAEMGPTCQRLTRRELHAQRSYATNSNKGRSPWSADPKLQTSAYGHNLMDMLRRNLSYTLATLRTLGTSTQCSSARDHVGNTARSLVNKKSTSLSMPLLFILGHHFAIKIR